MVPFLERRGGEWPADYVYDAVRHIARNCDYIESKTDPGFGWDYFNDAALIVTAVNLLRSFDVKCARCSGDGVVRSGHVDDLGERDCPSCNGSGRASPEETAEWVREVVEAARVLFPEKAGIWTGPRFVRLSTALSRLETP